MILNSDQLISTFVFHEACGRPHASWLRQVDSYLKDMGMMGLAPAWAIARWRPKEYRRKVDAATRCSGVCLTKPDLFIHTKHNKPDLFSTGVHVELYGENASFGAEYEPYGTVECDRIGH